nr:molybdopterin-binding protein [Galbitalea soli]
MTPAHLALAASAGHDTLSVVRRPRVALVLTGDEVVPSGIPPAGRVRDSFGPVLPALLASLGAITAGVVHLRDDPAALRAALLDTASGAELLVSTGGTGDSSADHLRAVLSELGAVLLVDGVRMRPGGPSILARLPDGRLVLGLPGNPLAAMMGILTLGVPLLARMTGGPFPEAATVTAAEPLPGRADTSFLVPYRLTGAGAGAVATDHRGAAMMRGLAAADGVLVCPPSGLEPGQAAASIGLPWR